MPFAVQVNFINGTSITPSTQNSKQENCQYHDCDLPGNANEFSSLNAVYVTLTAFARHLLLPERA
jgi:hypothetical protein